MATKNEIIDLRHRPTDCNVIANPSVDQLDENVGSIVKVNTTSGNYYYGILIRRLKSFNKKPIHQFKVISVHSRYNNVNFEKINNISELFIN